MHQVIFWNYIRHKQIQLYGVQGISINIIGGKDTRICSFDTNEEIRRHEPWTGNEAENKKMLNIFLEGGKYIYTDSMGEHTVDFKNGLYQYRDRKFIESLGEYEYNANNSEVAEDEEDYNSGLVKNKKKRVIIYTLQN